MKSQIQEAARLRPATAAKPKIAKPKKIYPPRDYVARFCMRLPKEVIEATIEAAKKEGVKTNQLIRFLLAESFAKPPDATGWETLHYHARTNQLDFDMPLEMKAELEKRAAELNLKQSKLVREILKQYLRENEGQVKSATYIG